MKIFGVIYKATCKITGKSYIGMTNDFKNRKHVHIRESLNGSNAHPKFYSAIRKYGVKNFEWAIIDCSGTLETLNICEMHWIEKFDSFHNGYNCTKGGEGFSSGKDNPMFNNGWFGKENPMFGRKHSEKTKMKMRLAHKGHEVSLETRRKIGLASRNRKRAQLTKQTKDKLSFAMKRRWALRRNLNATASR